MDERVYNSLFVEGVLMKTKLSRFIQHTRIIDVDPKLLGTLPRHESLDLEFPYA